MMQVRYDTATGSQPFLTAERMAGGPQCEPGIPAIGERRLSRRYDVAVAIRVRVLPSAGAPSEWRTGTVLDLSSTGIRFQCARPLPINSRVEMVVDWPAGRNTRQPVCLRASGDVVRSHGNQTAARMTSSRMGIEKAAASRTASASAFGG